MCGIFGAVAGPKAELTRASLREIVETLFALSETRGKESSGIAVRSATQLTLLKEAVAASELIRSLRFRKFFDEAVACHGGGRIAPPLAAIAHSRLVTNGLQTTNENNQPVATGDIVGVHNGIICNVEELYGRYESLERYSEVDTEVLLRMIAHFEQTGCDLHDAVARAFAEIEGAASVALLFHDRPQLVLATNTGSLYVGTAPEAGLTVFASEEYILSRLAARMPRIGRLVIEQVPARRGLSIDLERAATTRFSLTDEDYAKTPASRRLPVPVVNVSGSVATSVAGLRRCTCCILPETFPFIEFDDEGVCNVCRSAKPIEPLGHDALADAVRPFRRDDGRPDCIVGFSGGRDSSYCLHYLKAELGLNPIAFTYDWGLVTDLARRNQARICGKLGVEHILVSADINAKRRNVRKNVEAWLKRPELGMVPLLMAGDKQFFQHANRLAKQTGAPLIVFAACPYEVTHFKAGFAGINDFENGMYFSFPLANTLRLAAYYLTQFVRNPSYLNASLIDSASAFHSGFFGLREHLMFYDYVRWHEGTIDTVLKDEYNWELAPDTDSTWRIGDGTAPFYNYIYHTIAGFTEHDTFRSHQIRSGDLTRDEALDVVNRENEPRWESMRWYARTIGFDFNHAIKTINAVPKLYDMQPETIGSTRTSMGRAA